MGTAAGSHPWPPARRVLGVSHALVIVNRAVDRLIFGIFLTQGK
jgi:hypothetical protein